MTDTLSEEFKNCSSWIQASVEDLAIPFQRVITVLDKIENEVEKRQALARQTDPNAVAAELAQLQNRRKEFERQLNAARQLGMPEIQTATAGIRQQLDELESEEQLARTKRTLAGCVDGTHDVIEQSERARLEIQQLQDRQLDLEREQAEQTRLRDQLQGRAGEWDKRRQIREQRNKCLNIAAQIDALERILQMRLPSTQERREHND
ncbi:MAG: hypothetical protein WCF84_14065 [Anaerolineae bacterium]